MEQNVTQDQGQQTTETGAQTENAQTDVTSQAAATTPTSRMFTQDDVNRLLAEQKRALADRAKSQTEEAKKAAEAVALAEQGKFKDLYEKAQAELAAKAAEVKQMQIAQLRTVAATKHNLPPALVERLRGETAEEIEADAKALLAALPKAQHVNINSSAGQSLTGLNDAQRAEIAAKYGVSAKYIN